MAPAHVPLWIDLAAVAFGAMQGGVFGTVARDERNDFDILGVAVFALVMGLGGGVIRDVLSAEVPFVLRRGNLYASAVIAGIVVYRVLESVGMERQTASLVGMAVIAAIRLAAIRWELTLPVFEVNDGE